MARICMVGCWHQAMVYGAGLADIGHNVTGVCDTSEIASQLNAAKPVVHEPGLPALMRRNLRSGRLRYTSDYAAALARAQFAFISVDTPVTDDDRAELGGLFAMAREIRQHRRGNLILCISAQVPVGSSEKLLAEAHDPAAGYQSAVAYVPEFLQLGTAVATFRKADRIVVGADDPRVAKKVAALYAKLKRPMFLTNLRTAEMAKHASNTFLATSVSFINEIANVCDHVAADATMVAAILRADRRIGPHAFVTPGLGFAGGTLGRDVTALQEVGRTVGVPTPLMDAVLAVNRARLGQVIGRLERLLRGLRGRRIAMLGLTYKPRTSTLRRALSLEIIRALTDSGASATAFDPLADLRPIENLPPFRRVESPDEAAAGADAVVFMTEWDGIEKLSFIRLRHAMRGTLFVDSKNYFDPAVVTAAGLDYVGIGRPMSRAGSATRARS